MALWPTKRLGALFSSSTCRLRAKDIRRQQRLEPKRRRPDRRHKPAGSRTIRCVTRTPELLALAKFSDVARVICPELSLPLPETFASSFICNLQQHVSCSNLVFESMGSLPYSLKLGRDQQQDVKLLPSTRVGTTAASKRRK